MKSIKIGIILIILIILILLSIYILKLGSENFAILDIENLNNINDPVLKKAVEATEECTKLETIYRPYCYHELAWELGKNYGNFICEKLKEELKPPCYRGYGSSIGEEYNPNVEIIIDKCSKTSFYEDCLSGAVSVIGEGFAEDIELEQCQKFEQIEIKQRCYEGLGRQLARDNKGLSLCEKTKGKEKCLQGFATITDRKGNRKEALQICNKLSGENARPCYYRIGGNSIWVHNKSLKETFENCERYPYPEKCKQGAAAGIAYKFFEEYQKSSLKN